MSGRATGAGGLDVHFERVPLDRVFIGEDRLRKIDTAKVAAIAHTFALSGQLQPIRVARTTDGDLLLDIGLHRLEAARSLGWTMIWAGVVSVLDLSAQERRLQEIFENLIRAELTALDRAVALAELKAVHEALYPESRHGGDRRSQARKNKGENQTAILAIRSDVAEKVGLSDRAIRRAVEIAKGLGAEIRARLQGTWLADHQAGLQTLSEQPEARQQQILDILFATPPGAGSVADALVLAEGKRLPSSADRVWKTLADTYDRLNKKQRRTFFLDHREEFEAFRAELEAEQGSGGGGRSNDHA